MMNLHELTSLIEDKREEITAWMEEKRTEVSIPIYGSVDIRDAGWKIAVVDANHFPAGFNNVAKEDEEHLAALLRNHILRRDETCKWVHLYPEAHTRNAAYVENLRTLQRLISKAGFRCTVGSPELQSHGSIDGLSAPLLLDYVELKEFEGEQGIVVDGKRPDLILLNNDLTEGIVPGLGTTRVSPPPQMGWHVRKKSNHYEALRGYVNEISEMLGIEPWYLMTDWFISKDKCLDKEACRIELAAEVDDFLAKIATRYQAMGIDREPVVFIKNDSGTYGLGILSVKNGDELLALSNRKMKKLMYSKGGVDVENFLIQEGVPTCLNTESDGPVEPVVYLVDGQAASWFYRINEKKSDIENLNSPSAIFQSHSEVGHLYGKHAHGWHALVAELSMLAMGKEFSAYQK